MVQIHTIDHKLLEFTEKVVDANYEQKVSFEKRY
jgi:hypothetical protein